MVHRAVTLADFVFGSGDDCGIDVLLGADDRFVQRQSMGGKAATAEESVQPVPCVLGVSSRMERRGVALSVSAL